MRQKKSENLLLFFYKKINFMPKIKPKEWQKIYLEENR